MSTQDLLLEYGNTFDEYCDKKAELDALIGQWLDNEINMKSNEIQKIIDDKNNEIDELKSLADTYFNEYKKIVEEEARKKHAIYSLKQNFGVSPETMIITGGTLGVDAKDSHLEGRVKTGEELALEKKNLLNEIKRKLLANEIDLAKASMLKQQVETAYNFKNETQEPSRQR